MKTWDVDLIARQWAASAIASSDARKRAAVGLAQAVLLPDGDVSAEQRHQWAKQLLEMVPMLAGPVQSLAWLLPGRECRQVLLDLGHDPRSGNTGHSLRFAHDPIRSGAPAVVVAIGQGNLAALEQALETMDPTQPLAGGRAAVTNRDGDGSWQPETDANWLGWSLLLGQWELAERLWAHPGMNTQESLDRALFETVRGIVGNQKLPAPEALSWIQRLMDAGANPHASVAMTPEHTTRVQWFFGPIQGRPRETLEALGWLFFHDQPYCGYPTAGRLDTAPTGKDWTAARMAWRKDSPLLLNSPKPRARDAEVDPGDQACLDSLREGMGRLMTGASPHDWQDMLQQLMVATQAECFQSNASKTAVSWPVWVDAGWQQLPGDALFQDDDTRTDCLWLDLISLHHSARLQPELYGDLAQACGRGLEIVAGRLKPEPSYIVPGLMRAMATCARTGEDGMDEALATPGLRGLISKSSMAFRSELEQWKQEYANEAQQWQALRAICQNGATSAQWEEQKAAAETLSMLRASLAGLMYNEPSRRGPRARL